MSFTTFSLSRNNRRNTVISSPRGDEIFWIETPRVKPFGNNPTYVYKRSRFGSGHEKRELIAKLDFHAFRKDMIEYEGETCPLNDIFVRRFEWLQRYRLVSTEVGEWKWRIKKKKPELLTDNDEKRTLVRYYRNMHCLAPCSSSSSPTLEVERDALPYMDLVVLGWIVVMRDIEAERATASAGNPGAIAAI